MKKRILSIFLAIIAILSLSVFSVSAAGTTVNYYEDTNNGFFYPFTNDGDWTSKLSMSNKSFLADDGINHSGMLKVVNKAGQGALSTGFNSVKFQQGNDLVIRGKIRYLNTENLKEAKAFPAIYVTGLKGAPLYTDAACTVASDPATGGYYYINLTKDVSGKTYIDGQWHEFETVIPSKGAKHSTGKYVDLTGISTNIWFRPYNSNSFTATTDYFTQDYLDACAENGATPQVEVLLDDLEAYHVTSGSVMEETVTTYEKIFSFDTDANWKANTNRKHEATWRGRTGVATATSPQSTSSSYTHTLDTQVREGEKLRISAEIALGNPETLNHSTINANALLIMNGGNGNNPAGFYEDEACTEPCTSVNGNAITLSATMLKGIGADWNYFSYDFDTTKVIKSTIKRASSDSAKTTVYIKPWEIANVSVWFRVVPGTATATAIPASVFTQEYIDACAANGTTPSLIYGLDNFAVASVTEGEVLPVDVLVDSITADKETIMVGDTVNVSYALAYGKTETASRVYVKADGKIIGYIRNANGAFSFDVPETLYGKNLSVEIVPAAGVYSLNTYTQNLGTVSKVMFDASKAENGVTWSYDASEDTEDSIVIVALYNADDEMIKCVPVAITAGQSYGDTVTESTATFAKVFHWVSTSDAEPIEKNFSIDLSK